MTMTLSKPTSQAASAESDASELEALFQQHWERLSNVLSRITGDPQEAQDLVLETFVRLYRRPPEQRDNLSGWLYRVATNLAFNALRARKRRAAYEGETAALGMQPDPPADPEEAAARRQESQRVRLVLQSMKPRLARLLVLRHAGLSYAEVAQAVGLSRSSVGTLLARAEQEFERLYLAGERSEEDAP